MKSLKLSKGWKRAGVVFAATLAAAGLGATISVAASSSSSGTTTTVQRNLNQNTATLVPIAAAWHDVPTTSIAVSVPAGTTRLVESNFGAESYCNAASYCSVRVVALKSGVLTEFDPLVGTDYAFDSPGDNWDQHTVFRSKRLAAGTYIIKVQARVILPQAGAQFRLDDYTHAVDVAN